MKGASGEKRCGSGPLVPLALLLFAIGLAGCGKEKTGSSDSESVSAQIVGTWFAYRDNVIENMWTFRQDGTCINDGWPGDGDAEVQAPPYHLEGTYSVEPDKITVVFALAEGAADTVVLLDPEVANDRLVYTVGGIPVAFLRERVAAAQEPAAPADSGTADPALADSVTGDWVAFVGSLPANTWKFNADGTFVNEGWTRLSPDALLLKRVYRADGKYGVSGSRILLTNERITHFGAGPQGENTEVADAQNIVLYDVKVSRGRLIYTNEGGVPVAFRPGVVTPAEW